MDMFNINFTAHLTNNHQLKAADALISKLKIELGAANSYIDELEHDKNELISEIEKLKFINKKLNDKYSSDVQNFLKTDEIYKKYIETIDRITEDMNRIQHRNDVLIAEIIKLRDERNN